MNFYTKVLSRFATTSGLKLRIQVEVSPPDGLSKQTVEETKNALRELGLGDNLTETCQGHPLSASDLSQGSPLENRHASTGYSPPGRSPGQQRDTRTPL